MVSPTAPSGAHGPGRQARGAGTVTATQGVTDV